MRTADTIRDTALDELIVHTQATFTRHELIGRLIALTTGTAAYPVVGRLARLELKHAHETRELVDRVQGYRRGDRLDDASASAERAETAE